ncbi:MULTISPECIES: ribosome hibernation-promoting factor, HPF/YfiA family [Prochlorococcus]|uniref:Ribosome hibernation promoting factor n=1 Tax=Prochlorococcus marinus str. MIT 9116 TaxID=167544 RepID=A0A0A1ZSH3_PROMR|nr:ribosome-associated translation inhibitor RaiA [Prochlorococcus marinus]KGF90184.1 Ribosomal subunit interface protein [Prochlorococcus marinus str. MIT 9107]KGF91209.1 Ribosomal subunit interface protein [Prochlorococcus marinus str. MIT 9116]KGF94877.1 Ribosomal subunit interface protein [Prochlorococcus marinus str. MIT 9123]
MKILIHGKNLELTGALKEYTEAKIEKATHHYKDIVKEAEIHLSIEKNPRVSFQTAEVTIFANGTVIRAEEKTENLYSSIDLVSNKLCRKLRKYKERNNKTIHKNQFKNKEYFQIENTESRFSDKALLKEGMEASLPEPSIKNKYFEMTPISLEEARKQLDLIDHDFYVFRNKKNNELQVIYKRNHGGYGLIQSK